MARRRRRNSAEVRLVNVACVVVFVTIIAAVLVPEVDAALTVAAIVLGGGAVLFGTGLVPFIVSTIALHRELGRTTSTFDMEAWQRARDANRNAIPSPPQDRPLLKAVAPAQTPGDDQ